MDLQADSFALGLLRAPAERVRRWVLAVLLALGAGWISPLIHPVGVQIVCTADAPAAVVADSEDALVLALFHHAHECPLCAPGAAPPTWVAPLSLSQPLHASGPLPFARTLLAPVFSAAPLQARAPPYPALAACMRMA